MRNTITNSAPWLPWLAPSVVGALDAANLINEIATPLYVALIVGAATVTILARGPRIVCELLGRRWEHAAENAQVGEAATLIYQLASEHIEARHAVTEELPQAVGIETTGSIPALRVVRAAGDTGHDAVFRRAASVGRAAVPQQVGRPAQMAAARRQRPEA